MLLHIVNHCRNITVARVNSWFAVKTGKRNDEYQAGGTSRELPVHINASLFLNNAVLAPICG
jgi:hypothetical protein